MWRRLFFIFPIQSDLCKRKFLKLLFFELTIVLHRLSLEQRVNKIKTHPNPLPFYRKHHSALPTHYYKLGQLQPTQFCRKIVRHKFTLVHVTVGEAAISTVYRVHEEQEFFSDYLCTCVSWICLWQFPNHLKEFNILREIAVLCAVIFVWFCTWKSKDRKVWKRILLS